MLSLYFSNIWFFGDFGDFGIFYSGKGEDLFEAGRSFSYSASQNGIPFFLLHLTSESMAAQPKQAIV
jgi:hypothetical protein